MKKILYPVLTLMMGLVLIGACNKQDAIDPHGVLIGDLLWAKYNVGTPGTFAAKPEDPGMFYQWNRKVAWPTTGVSVDGWDASMSSSQTWGFDNDPCPDGWRVPTQDEFANLRTYGYAWDNVNKGGIFGTAPNTIFLPAAGRRGYGGSLANAGITGNYWSNEWYDVSNPTYAKYFHFQDGSTSIIPIAEKVYAMSVRCVKDVV